MEANRGPRRYSCILPSLIGMSGALDTIQMQGINSNKRVARET
jgi:hypothetical protein